MNLRQHKISTKTRSLEVIFHYFAISQSNQSLKSTELQDEIEKIEVERKKPSERQYFINIKIYYAQLFLKIQKNSNTFYVVLKYNNDKNGISITSCQQENHNFIQWNELSNRFKLSKSVSNLEIKIFDKNFYKL